MFKRRGASAHRSPLWRHGTTIPAGSQVLLYSRSANRDERADKPGFRRPNQRHLGMGQGIHFCVDAPPACTVAKFRFEELLTASDHWKIDLTAAARGTTPDFRGF